MAEYPAWRRNKILTEITNGVRDPVISGRAGGLKTARRRKAKARQHRHSDEFIQTMWWNN